MHGNFYNVIRSVSVASSFEDSRHMVAIASSRANRVKPASLLVSITYFHPGCPQMLAQEAFPWGVSRFT
jgi:hypothetical protein